ncbi:MAG: hypoxanthine phosphoribosyltransferase [Bacteroidia bacterium]
MPSVITVWDKQFVPAIPAREISQRIAELADEMNVELRDKNPLFLAVLNGSFFFAADLLRELDFVCEISFVKLASYSGLSSSGTVRELIGLEGAVAGRNVVVLEDIVDTGKTINQVVRMLKEMEVKSVAVAALLLKPDALQEQVELDFIGFKVPNQFLVGYGLDYNQLGRNYRDIYRLKE